MMDPGEWKTRMASRWRTLSPGLMVSGILAIAAQFLAEHYGAPAMLMALLMGMALNFLAEEGRCVEGIDFSAKVVVRFGVALLGARISFELLTGLGPGPIVLVILGVVTTILFALLGARVLGRGWRLALLTGGAVAICGVSAAMAIAAILPKNQHSERNLIFTVISVAVLSTFAMILYPIASRLLGLSEVSTGVFLGGTIHDVAQVVGAGFLVSEQTGETATVVKLIRVSMLAPVVLILSLIIHRLVPEDNSGAKRPPLVPMFVLAFLLLAGLNSFGAIPISVAGWMSGISRWALLGAIAAVGMKTSLRRIFEVGGQAIVLIVAESLFLVVFVLAGIYYLGR